MIAVMFSKIFLISLNFEIFPTTDVGSNQGRAKTKVETLGFIFDGDAIASFDPIHRPLEWDVIKLWMYLYDKERGSNYRMSIDQKEHVIQQVVKRYVTS